MTVNKVAEGTKISGPPIIIAVVTYLIINTGLLVAYFEIILKANSKECPPSTFYIASYLNFTSIIPGFLFAIAAAFLTWRAASFLSRATKNHEGGGKVKSQIGMIDKVTVLMATICLSWFSYNIYSDATHFSCLSQSGIISHEHNNRSATLYSWQDVESYQVECKEEDKYSRSGPQWRIYTTLNMRDGANLKLGDAISYMKSPDGLGAFDEMVRALQGRRVKLIAKGLDASCHNKNLAVVSVQSQ